MGEFSGGVGGQGGLQTQTYLAIQHDFCSALSLRSFNFKELFQSESTLR